MAHLLLSHFYEVPGACRNWSCLSSLQKRSTFFVPPCTIRPTVQGCLQCSPGGCLCSLPWITQLICGPPSSKGEYANFIDLGSVYCIWFQWRVYLQNIDSNSPCSRSWHWCFNFNSALPATPPQHTDPRSIKLVYSPLLLRGPQFMQVNIWFTISPS